MLHFSRLSLTQSSYRLTARAALVKAVHKRSALWYAIVSYMQATHTHRHSQVERRTASTAVDSVMHAVASDERRGRARSTDSTDAGGTARRDDDDDDHATLDWVMTAA